MPGPQPGSQLYTLRYFIDLKFCHGGWEVLRKPPNHVVQPNNLSPVQRQRSCAAHCHRVQAGCVSSLQASGQDEASLEVHALPTKCSDCKRTQLDSTVTELQGKSRSSISIRSGEKSPQMSIISHHTGRDGMRSFC